MHRLSPVVLVFAFMPLYDALAQEERRYYREAVGDPYVAVPKEQRKYSHAYTLRSSGFHIVQVNVDAQGKNILGDAANEPTIAIDPNNPDHLVIGWRQFETVKSNFRQAGMAISKTGGETWVAMEPLEAGVFRTDPVLAADNDGSFYYNSQSAGPVCSVFKSHDLTDWDHKADAHGGDKAWMTIDNTGWASDGMLYTYWNANYSSCGENAFTRSFDGGQSFDSCSFVPDNPHWGTLATGTDGELYLFGRASTSLRVLRSDQPASDGPVIWDLNTPVDLKGILDGYTGPNPAGLMGQAWTVTDPALPGHIYVLASVQRTDNSDSADVMFTKSMDHGETWSDALCINDDNSIENWQWFGTMSIAPNGRLDAVWLDTRDNPGTYLSALYYAFSADGGTTWSENERLSEAFDPHVGWPNQNKIGDYFHMVSENSGAHLAWAATFNDEQDVYYSFIETRVSTSIALQNNTTQQAKACMMPNPARGTSRLLFHLNDSRLLRTEVRDVLGNVIIAMSSQWFKKGAHSLSLNLHGLSSGLYFVIIRDGEAVIAVCQLVCI